MEEAVDPVDLLLDPELFQLRRGEPPLPVGGRRRRGDGGGGGGGAVGRRLHGSGATASWKTGGGTTTGGGGSFSPRFSPSGSSTNPAIFCFGCCAASVGDAERHHTRFCFAFCLMPGLIPRIKRR